MVEVEIIGVEAAERALASMVSTLTRAADDLMEEHATEQAERARRAADTSQARLAAKGIRARRGELAATGGDRLPNGNGTYADIFFGAEFGAGQHPQFRTYRPGGYWFFPSIESGNDDLERAAEKVTDTAADRWAG